MSEKDQTFFSDILDSRCLRVSLLSRNYFRMPNESCAFIIYCDIEILPRMFSIKFLSMLRLALQVINSRQR